MGKKKGQTKAPAAPKAPDAEKGTEAKAPDAEKGTEAKAPDAEKGTEAKAPDAETGTEAKAPDAETLTVERDGETLIADHTHAGVVYPAGTKLDDIDGLTANNVAFLVQNNKV